jgi:hypothetical protein
MSFHGLSRAYRRTFPKPRHQSATSGMLGTKRGPVQAPAPLKDALPPHNPSPTLLR